MTLRDEILEQPAAVTRQLGSSVPALDAVAGRLRDDPVDSVVIAARGTSDHAAIYAQYAFGVRNGLAVALATPSVFSLYGATPDLRRALTIGISQSGASPDIVGVVVAAARQGGPTLAITNDPASPLATTADHVIDLAAGPELAVAATKTYSTSLAAIARLSLALAPDGTEQAALAALPAAIEVALGVEAEVEAIAHELVAGGRSIDRTVVVGRGFEYPNARELALKMKELAQVFADPYSAADFLHGPIALVQPGIPVVVFAPDGAALPGQLDLLRGLRDRGVETIVLSDLPAARALGRWSIELPTGIPEWLRPIVSIAPAQLLAYYVTLARGLDPDEPRYLSKVTRTT